MRILNPGEPCPCCGTPIPAGISRRNLLLLSFIAEGLSLLSAVEAMGEVWEPPKVGPVEPDPVPEPPKRRTLPERDIGPLVGRNSTEKRAIMERLQAYRTAHGLGCWTEVAKASGGKLDDEILRSMSTGTAVLPVSEWRLAAKALDKLGGRQWLRY